MIDLIKELWYKRKARFYLLQVRKISDMRRALNTKQRVFKEKAEEYARLYKETSRL